MPTRTTFNGLTEEQRSLEVPKLFFKYTKIPNSIAEFCDEQRIYNIRTPQFIQNNIFGTNETENEIVLKKHVVIILGDEEEFELVNNNGDALLYNEFCI